MADNGVNIDEIKLPPLIKLIYAKKMA